MSQQAAIYAGYATGRSESAAQLGSAQQLLAEMQAQNEMQLAITANGADSVEVTELRAQAERDTFEETLATLDISEALKEELRQALEFGIQLGQADISSGINSAAAAAAALAQQLGVSLSIAQQIVASSGNVGGVSTDPTIGGFEANDPRGAPRGVWTGGYSHGTPAGLRTPRSRTPRTGGGSGSSGAGGVSAAAREAEREQEAVDNLIGSLEDELAIMREIDPIQQEMLRNRETLANASAAERGQIEALITTRIRENEILEQQEELWGETKSAAQGFFDDLRSSSGGLDAALGGISDRLLALIDQAIMFGEGPLASLMGFGGGGGGNINTIFGAIFPGAAGAAIPARAYGGKIYGPGSGTSDDVLMWGSNGEFMMTAEATQKYQPILEQMNSGSLPMHAMGGRIGGGSSAPAYAPPSMPVVIENRGSTPVSGEVQEESDSRGGRQFKLILADEVGSALTTKGGGARRALRNGYGVSPARTRR